MSGIVHDIAARPMRMTRVVARFEDGSFVAITYDETLELQHLVSSGASQVSASIASTADPGTVFTHQQGTGDRETALPNTTATKLRATRAGFMGRRWAGIQYSIAGP